MRLTKHSNDTDTSVNDDERQANLYSGSGALQAGAQWSDSAERASATVAIPPYNQTLRCGCNELPDWPQGDQSKAYGELKSIATLIIY